MPETNNNNEHTSVYYLAKKYYPDMWSKDRLRALVRANKLSLEEYKELTNEEFL